MERLTERFADRYIAIKGCGIVYKDAERKGALAANAIVRLAAYEDTGLEPQEVSEAYSKGWQNALDVIAYAEQDGTVLVDIPLLEEYIKIGTLDHFRELAQAEKEGRLAVMPVKPGTKVYGIGYNFGSYGLVERYYNLAYYRPEEFLIATFKTHEEAEAALKKMEEADNEAVR